MSRKEILRFWNGRSQGSWLGYNSSLYIAAYSRAHAVALINEAFLFKVYVSYREVQDYFSECWGNPMIGFDPKLPCIYYVRHNDPPRLLLKYDPLIKQNKIYYDGKKSYSEGKSVAYLLSI